MCSYAPLAVASRLAVCKKKKKKFVSVYTALYCITILYRFETFSSYLPH